MAPPAERPGEVIDDNARQAIEIRRRRNRPLLWGLPLLALGLLAGAACLLLLLLIDNKAILVPVAVAGSLVAFIGIMAFLLALMLRARWSRSLALLAVADELGLAFHERADRRLCQTLEPLTLFVTASGVGGSNVLTGPYEGLTVTLLDCIFSVGDGQNVAAFEGTLFVLRGLPPNLPSFYLTPHDLFSRRMKHDRPEVTLSGEPQLSKRFLLLGEDRKALRATFTPRLIAHLLDGPDQNIEVDPPLLVVQRRGKPLPPAQVPDFLKACVLLARLLGVPPTSG